ncbi:hypothetical protein J6590_061113 [Homalodisca vitripennis]|nr:hypothetical protein J6590_061113 [Homalodisca vitripennis]
MSQSTPMPFEQYPLKPESPAKSPKTPDKELDTRRKVGSGQIRLEGRTWRWRVKADGTVSCSAQEGQVTNAISITIYPHSGISLSSSGWSTSSGV